MPEEVVLLNVPGPGDPTVVEIGTPGGVITVPVPTPVPELGPLTARVVVLEESDTEQDGRLAALEIAGGGEGVGLEAVQELVDTSITVHVQATEPHPVYDDLPDLMLLLENGMA